MAHTIYAGKVNKRRNSTLQPTLSTSFDVLLKTPTSLHTPTFTINASAFDFNYLKWDDRYYFVTDVVARNNNLWDVSAIIDVLATYKADILASTQYVSYSSEQGNAWLADTRIPVLKSTQASKSTVSIGSLFNSNGFYVLTCVGQDGCNTFAADITNLHDLLNEINNWSSNILSNIRGGTYQWGTTEEAIQSLGDMLIQSGVAGNAYADAPSCIRSCVWVPFSITGQSFLDATKDVYLGQFPTGLRLFTLKGSPATGSVSVNIPWHFSDWRRAYCEDVYIYLPLVGMIALSSDNLTNVSSITVRYSATATDGVVSYQIVAGNEIIGSYGGQCSANYPIGVSQQASAGEVITTAFAGAEKMVNMAINSSISPISAGAAGVGATMAGIEATYNLANATLTRHNSCIGGVGGGAGAGLDLNVTCYTVAHNTIVEPADMVATMGRPTMKPLQLSTLTGFCQCANAHVSAAAEAQELDAIDTYLNSGFYIE